MASAEPVSSHAPQPKRVRWFRRLAGWLWNGCLGLLLLWGTLALYYCSPLWMRLPLAVVFAGFGMWALWLSRRPRMRWAFAVAFLAVLGWFASLSPSQHRPWRREVAVLPQAFIDGDKVRITGFRNFEYRSVTDFTEHYEEREVDLSHLTSVDFYVSYWKIGPVAHTFLSFEFDNAPPVCISIETRPEEGEGFAPIASLFKQFELIYVVGDERDLVRVRTNFRGEQTFLYPLRATPEQARQLFLVYLKRINELHDRPEWYHLLKSNCTLNIVRYANKAGRQGGLDIGHILNGWSDRYLYRAGHVNSSLPFEELRARARINDAAKTADEEPDFWERIRWWSGDK